MIIFSRYILELYQLRKNDIPVVSLLAKLEFHEIVTCIALVDVSSDNRVVFHSWVTISWLELNLVESSLVTGLEHKVVGNVEDVKRRFWGRVD